jgi:hypothetical protein
MAELVLRERRTARTLPLLVAAGLVVLLVVLVAGYLVYGLAMAGSEDSRAASTLDQARKHNNQVYDALTGPSMPRAFGSNDVTQAGKALSGYAAALKAANDRIGADLQALKAEDSRLKADEGSPAMLLEQGRLGSDRRRVEGMTSAFSNARTALGIIQGQLPAYEALLDFLTAFDQLTPLLQKQDYSGALALYGQMDAKMQALTASMSRANIPPDFTKGVGLIKALVDDFRPVLQAIASGDYATAQSQQPNVDQDIGALNAWQPTGMDAYETNLLRPYRDAYVAGIKKAGFTVSGS